MRSDDPTPKPRRTRGAAQTDSPYRPPAPGEAESPIKFCPDCARDPEHPGEEGYQPVSEFRAIRGKGAERYADGVRLAAYCRYHERKRALAYKRAKMAEATPEEQAEIRAKRRKANISSERRYRAAGKRLREDRARRKRLREQNPERAEEIMRQRRAAYTAWAEEHVEERRAYRAAWFRERMDREIAAGLRPPRGERRGVGRPRGGGFWPASRRRR